MIGSAGYGRKEPFETARESVDIETRTRRRKGGLLTFIVSIWPEPFERLNIDPILCFVKGHLWAAFPRKIWFGRLSPHNVNIVGIGNTGVDLDAVRENSADAGEDYVRRREQEWSCDKLDCREQDKPVKAASYPSNCS